MLKSLLSLVTLSFSFATFGQITGNIRGRVFDNQTNTVIPGARVQLYTSDTTLTFLVKTNDDGIFSFNNIPVGKHTLTVKNLEYNTLTTVVEVNSGKESVLEIPLLELLTNIGDVEIVARKQGEVLNEMALGSARQFSVEETNRYPGSRSDPARMASNFAGVQGADDSRNDIVVRGNSPLGLVWKLEGIDLPNPNHFAISGSTGGPVSIINNKMLGNSDFFMSAFPAEYGNSLGGIFDLKLRNGNNKQHEFTGQFGFLGTEIMTEGPLSKKSNGSSYMVMARYSTLSIFQKIGIKIGTDAVPIYGDYAFKFNFPLKNGGKLSLFSLGGKSKISIKISDQTEYSTEFYGEGDRDQFFGTSMSTSGLNYKKTIGEKHFLTVTTAFAYDEQHADHFYLIRSLDTLNKGTSEQVINVKVDSTYRLLGYQFKTSRGSLNASMNTKLSKKHLLRYGFNFDLFYFNNIDSVHNDTTSGYKKRWDYKGTSALIQPFIQWKWRIQEKMDFTAGLHAQYFSLSKSLSIFEPRLGWKYGYGKNNTLTAAAGLHSQTQPNYIYTYRKEDANGNFGLHNKNMGFSKSFHSVIGYEKSLGKQLNLKIETYYQYLFNIPVEQRISSLSLINQGSGFARFFPDTLKNTGIGQNYGIELTLQKYFNQSFFFMISGSVYDSKYQGSDKIWRNTSYNSLFGGNFLAGKEFKIGQKHVISFGVKTTYAGGRRYGYVDVNRSKIQKEIVFSDSLFNTRQFRDYFRLDVKLAYKLNTKRITHEFGLDLVNLLNTKNLLSLAYAPKLGQPNAEPIAEKNQLGFLPIFYYKIDFKLANSKNSFSDK